jgi:hypothetical protein
MDNGNERAVAQMRHTRYVVRLCEASNVNNSSFDWMLKFAN